MLWPERTVALEELVRGWCELHPHSLMALHARDRGLPLGDRFPWHALDVEWPQPHHGADVLTHLRD